MRNANKKGDRSKHLKPGLKSLLAADQDLTFLVP